MLSATLTPMVPRYEFTCDKKSPSMLATIERAFSILWNYWILWAQLLLWQTPASAPFEKDMWQFCRLSWRRGLGWVSSSQSHLHPGSLSVSLSAQQHQYSTWESTWPCLYHKDLVRICSWAIISSAFSSWYSIQGEAWQGQRGLALALCVSSELADADRLCAHPFNYVFCTGTMH